MRETAPPHGPQLPPLERGEVTLAICTRDRPEMLSDALAQVARVTPGAVEVLVVDSASTTVATATVATAAGARYVRSDVPGLSIARNLALATSSRAIVVFTDDDCLLTPGWTDTLLERFRDPGVTVVTGRLRDLATAGSEAAAVAAAAAAATAEDNAVAAQAPVVLRGAPVLGLDAGHGALMAFRRERLVALGAFDELLGAGRRYGGAEDLDAFARALGAGDAVVHEPRSVVEHTNVREGTDYLALHAAYGRGLGAMATRWVRSRPLPGLRIAVVIVRRALVRAVRGDGRHRRAQLALLRGFVEAAVATRRTPIAGGVFVDVNPPAAIPNPNPEEVTP